MKRALAILAACVVAAVGLYAQASEKIDYQMLGKIREEGLNHSQAMEIESWIADVYGPRMPGSPGYKQAADWVVKKMTDLGFANVHIEKWPFGKGWQLKRFSAQMIEPQVMPIIGTVRAWTPGTNGAVLADVVRVEIASEADFARYQGKLAGKIVLAQPPREVKMLEGRITWRMNDDLLKEAETMPIPPARPAARRPPGPTLQDKINDFFRAENVAAAIDRGSDQSIVAAGGMENMTPMTQRTDGGTVFVGGPGPHDAEHAGKTMVPSVTIAVEQYNRMVRILDKGVPVRMELNIDADFYDETEPNGWNIIGEIPGGDLAGEVVLLGAHFDTEPGATGATDDAAGCTVMMEALRILKAAGARPRRTVRVALWSAEEEGLLGSKAYVREHLADIATLKLKPEHERLSAYYNVDNGSGRIRGVWMQGNLAVRPIFQQWIEPLRDLGVTTLAGRAVSGSDYVSFEDAGIPAFQFIQDRLEYNSRTHHSNMDYVDRVQRDDVLQMAVVVATFAYNTAMRDEKLPRKPLPAPQATSR